MGRLATQVDLILQAQKGDVEARNELILSNMGLIRHIIATVVGKHRVNEFLSDGVLGFIRGIEGFDPTKVKNHVGSWFWFAVRARVFETIRKQTLYESRKNALALMRTIWRPIPPSDFLELQEVWESLDELPPVQRRILIERASGIYLRDIAKGLGVSKQRIDQIERKALRALREKFLQSDTPE